MTQLIMFSCLLFLNTIFLAIFFGSFSVSIAKLTSILDLEIVSLKGSLPESFHCREISLLSYWLQLPSWLQYHLHNYSSFTHSSIAQISSLLRHLIFKFNMFQISFLVYLQTLLWINKAASVRFLLFLKANSFLLLLRLKIGIIVFFVSHPFLCKFFSSNTSRICYFLF